MFGKEAYFEPTAVDLAEVKGLAARVRKVIEGAVEPEISPELRKLVQTRVRLRNVDHYSNLKKIGFLVAAEIGDLGSRIRHYQYIERYRFAMEPLSPEMSAAFARHGYQVRHGEVYGIRELTVKLLAFLYEIGPHIKISTVNQAGPYSRRFGDVMSFRLRERHRMTHAHEPPSLSSRVLEFAAEITDQQRGRETVSFLLAIMKEAQDAIFAGEAVDEFDPMALMKVNLKQADEEAALMWEMAKDSIQGSIALDGA